MTAAPDDIWRGACSVDPQAWDLDYGTLTSWMRAAAICQTECLFLTQCRALRKDVHPVTTIMAGVAYGDSGVPLDIAGLRRFWAAKRNRGRRSNTAAA